MMDTPMKLVTPSTMRRAAKFAGSFAAALIATAALAAPAFAAEGASPNPADTPTGFVFRWLNFILVFGTAAYFVARYGGPIFRGRAAGIGGAIREAAAAKAEAERELREVEDKVAHLDQEIARLHAESERESEAEAERQVLAGQHEIERIDRGARFEVEASERVFRQQLRVLAAQMAIEAAEKELRAGLGANEAERATLFQSFIAQLGSMSKLGSMKN
jgi:F0F1-type ATP synthase membrane subunit b/b'